METMRTTKVAFDRFELDDSQIREIDMLQVRLLRIQFVILTFVGPPSTLRTDTVFASSCYGEYHDALGRLGKMRDGIFFTIQVENFLNYCYTVHKKNWLCLEGRISI